jgi:site-specific recombinase XerD
MKGRPLLEVKELLGHQEITMTMRYAHLSPGRLREAVGCLDEVLGRRKRP